MYFRLDKELNLIKEYFKVSGNKKEFKRNVRKMTRFDGFEKEVEEFLKDPGFSQDIMDLYARGMWDVEMPKFLENEPMHIESPQITALKNKMK